MATYDTRKCTVYTRRGAVATTIEGPPPMPARFSRTIADHVPLGGVMSDELICARTDLELPKILALMVEHHVGCIPVIDERRHPLGVITKFDIVEQLAVPATSDDGALADLMGRTAGDIMMPIALILDERATIAHAAAMMTTECTHHVLVVRDGELVGVVSSKDIVTWLAANDGLAPRDAERATPPLPRWRPLEG